MTLASDGYAKVDDILALPQARRNKYTLAQARPVAPSDSWGPSRSLSCFVGACSRRWSTLSTPTAHIDPQVREAVEDNDKKRFALKEEGGIVYIRANQGHSDAVRSLLSR